MKTAKVTKTSTGLKNQPPYHVILIDDQEHTHQYVVEMMGVLFGFSEVKSEQIAHEVHDKGKCILITTTREYAEFKQEQIQGYGPDKNIIKCKGSMRCDIEPAR